MGPIIVEIIYGKRWANGGAGTLLQYYGMYLAVLPANGITEAFVSGVSSGKALKSWNVLLAAWSVVYVTVAVLLSSKAGGYGLDLGLPGLVIAATFSMLIRIYYSAGRVSTVLGCSRMQVLSAVFPSGKTLFVAFVLAFCAQITDDYYNALAKHPSLHYSTGPWISFGRFLVAGIATLLSLLVTESVPINITRALLRGETYTPPRNAPPTPAPGVKEKVM